MSFVIVMHLQAKKKSKPSRRQQVRPPCFDLRSPFALLVYRRRHDSREEAEETERCRCHRVAKAIYAGKAIPIAGFVLGAKTHPFGRDERFRPWHLGVLFRDHTWTTDNVRSIT